jgi:hemerythrin-like domain-containing protein
MALEVNQLNRRGALALAAALASGAAVSGGGLILPAEVAAQAAKEKKPAGNEASKQEDPGAGEDVGATEDLMREHGVLRRTLIVYSEVSQRLLSGAGKVDPTSLAQAAKLFREFGEQYHERTLEEQYIFPEVRKAGGPNEKLVEVLLSQHQRGRDITDYISSVTATGSLTAVSDRLADVLTAMARMYQAHSAWEDTIIFPAWKKTQSKARLDELAEKFEEIEHQQFGKDGFDDALERIAQIEQALGLADLRNYTASSPPRT